MEPIPPNYIILPKQINKVCRAISFEISLGINKSYQVFQIHQEQICFHFYSPSCIIIFCLSALILYLTLQIGHDTIQHVAEP